ncbi:DUF4157 domain-containing protein [Streptomyces sp. NBC_01142]|uniref:eCIS core domain-containing protein n=1 Tax=Streptomyces sp. NBC_01142 TaxID=2975865 RepID=UPI002259AB62|nr:DUF4157 domain-containing protein [Streptomyces sp. NBC_01142]MCX4821041.1 DUF4157 domain-containing protein [Streptomyces sp. NBC_01142]
MKELERDEQRHEQEGRPASATLGELLDAQARWLSGRLTPTFPWAGPLGTLIEHAGEIAAPFDGRFDRVESAPESAGAALRPTATRAFGRETGPETGPETDPGARPGPAAWPDRKAPGARADRFTPGRPLPADVRSRLRDVAGPAADALRVHDDDTADSLAHAHRADAVTVGRNVYFRAGRFQPREPRGFGLLVHEATHVLALLRPGAAWRRATGGGAQDEEAEALAGERAAVAPGVVPQAARHGGPPAPHALPHPTLHTTAPGHLPSPAHSPAARPAAAPADRDGQLSPAVSAPPPPDLERLRQSLLDELMHRLRTDFERGG